MTSKRTEIMEVPSTFLEFRRELAPKLRRMQWAINTPLAIQRELNNRSFYEFFKCFWSEISQDAYQDNWHIPYLCQELQEISERAAAGLEKEYDLIINIPPGTTKTTIVSIMFPVWCWTRWFWMRFITSSYSDRLSLESAEYARDLLRSNKFNQMYPDLKIVEDKDTKSNYRIQKLEWTHNTKPPVTRKGGNRFSTSVGGSLTGFHGHILIVDDPVNPKQAVSQVELSTANKWMSNTLSTRKINKSVTPTIIVMQRLHQNDLSGNLLEKKKGNVKHICLPGEIRNYAHKLKPEHLKGMYVDDCLDAVRMPWPVLREMETDLGQYGYAGQVGQDPVPPGGGMFKVDNFVVVDSLPAEVNFMGWVRYWDKAGTAGGGAWTCGVKMLKLRNGKVIIAEVKKGQWSTEIREKIIRQTAEADGMAVEIWFEQEPGSGGKESAEATIRNLAGFAAHADLPHGDKIYRADPYSVQVNNGNVLLLRGDWIHDFVEEHRYFPFSTYKDQVDAAAGAFNQLMHKKIARVI